MSRLAAASAASPAAGSRVTSSCSPLLEVVALECDEEADHVFGGVGEGRSSSDLLEQVDDVTADGTAPVERERHGRPWRWRRTERAARTPCPSAVATRG